MVDTKRSKETERGYNFCFFFYLKYLYYGLWSYFPYPSSIQILPQLPPYPLNFKAPLHVFRFL